MNVSTMHSLAYRSVGQKYHHRLNGQPMESEELAQRLSVEPLPLKVRETSKALAGPYLASLAMKAITHYFCRSVDPEPAPDHVPYIEGIDMPDKEGRRSWWNNNQVREFLIPTMRKIWKDLVDPNGQLQFHHDHYLKIWALTSPVIPVDFILFDEAQDADPVMLSVISGQPSAQLVLVGDSEQQIYQWRGAVNALKQLEFERAFLR
jgi:superfamily I DNA/RNA helicase